MIKVYLSRRDPLAGIDFYIVEQNEFDNKRYILNFGKYNITRQEIKEGEKITEPTFRLNEGQGTEFLKSVAELASDHGIKLESDLKREGRLEATEKHLEDMRKLVFSKDKGLEVL